MPDQPTKTKKRMDYARLPAPNLLYAIEEFVDGVSPDKNEVSTSDVAKRYNEKYAERIAAEEIDCITRENVYPMIREARKRGYLTVMPPVDAALVRAIESRFQVRDDSVSVLQCSGKAAADYLAHHTSRRILDLIDSVRTAKLESESADSRVHLGFVGGATVMKVARELARLIGVEGRRVPLCLHVLSSGFDIERPSFAPITFLAYFDDVAPIVDHVGLFAPAVADAASYAKTIKEPGIEKSFKRAREVDIVITSFATASDAHGELNHFMGLGRKASRLSPGASELMAKGWVGDVSYRPYSNDGPIQITKGKKLVSLFELADLVKLAKTPDKYVVLVGAPCNACGESKGDALRPLLEAKNLKLWTHLLMDMDTAQTLLNS